MTFLFQKFWRMTCCQLLLVTAHLSIQSPTAFSHCPQPPITLRRLLSPTMASCYWPAAFDHCSPPPVNAHPFYYCLPYPITANCFLSLPTASYFNYTLRRVVVSWSLQHYFIPLCNLKHCIARNCIISLWLTSYPTLKISGTSWNYLVHRWNLNYSIWRLMLQYPNKNANKKG